MKIFDQCDGKSTQRSRRADEIITITVDKNDLDLIIEDLESLFNYYPPERDEEVEAAIKRIVKAIAFAQKNPGTILDNALKGKK